MLLSFLISFLLILIGAESVAGKTIAKPPAKASTKPPAKPPARNIPLVFNPGRPILDAGKPSSSVTVRLARKPKAAVAVHFAGPSIKFNRCSMTFTANNWNKPQRLHMMPGPLYIRTKVPRIQKIRFRTSSCNDPQFNSKLQDLSVVRTSGAPASCTSAGDPHYKVF